MSTTKISLIDGNEYCWSNGQFSRHLRSHGLDYQDYYEKYITGEAQKCPFCGARKKFYQEKNSYANTCGSPTCVGLQVKKIKSTWTKEKRAEVVSKRIKTIQSRSEEEKERLCRKIKEKLLETRGVESIFYLEEFKLKSRKTKMERYGNEFYAGWEKSAEKNRNKSAHEKNLINEKRRKTNLERLGVPCPFLLPNAQQNSKISNATGKEYITPSGKIIRVSGYEDKALDKLLEMGYMEDDIMVDTRCGPRGKAVPTFSYINANQHRQIYYPDIYIPKENKIIEIKSQWWWDGRGSEKYKGRLKNNLLKKDAVVSSKYDYEVWIYDEKLKDFRITRYGKIQEEY